VSTIGEKFVVNVDNMDCSCRKWGITGVPCSHSLAAMEFLNLSVDPFVAHWFTKSTYEEIYCSIIYPVNGQDVWEITPFPDVLPPLKRILPGRPKKKRRLQASEMKKDDTQVRRGGIRKKCSTCKQLGHNRTTCPQAPPSPPTPPPTATSDEQSVPPNQGPTADEGQNISNQQAVPPNQGPTAAEGQNICSQQTVTPSQPPTSAQYVPPTQPSISGQYVLRNMPPAVNCTQGSTSTSTPPLTAHPTATPIPPSRGRPNIRPKLQHRRGRVWKP